VDFHSKIETTQVLQIELKILGAVKVTAPIAKLGRTAFSEELTVASPRD